MRHFPTFPASLRTALGLVAILAASLLVSAAKPLDGQGDGHFVASPVDDCEGDLVCVEWEYFTTGGSQSTGEPCCADPSLVGSTQYQFCGESFRHEH